MPQNVSRILLALCMVPLVIAVWLITDEVIGRELGFGYRNSAVFGGTISAAFVYMYWLFVCRDLAFSTLRRRQMTLWGVILSLGAGLIVGLVIFRATRDKESATVPGMLLASCLWIIITSLGWRESKDERIDRIRNHCAMAMSEILLCGKCGYQMAGLTQARCPECGTEYTLDALVAVNAERLATAKDPTASFDA